MNESTKKEWRRTLYLNLRVWVALLLLLAITAGSAWIHMGAWNSIVNLAVATAKALLVAIFFMHLRHAGSGVRLAAGIGLFVLFLLFTLSSADYQTRRMLHAPWQVPKQLQPVFHAR